MQNYTANLLVMVDEQAAAAEVAQRFACSSVKSIADHGAFSVAIPGGSSPRRVFELLTHPEYSMLIQWSKTHVFFTDERCVPPDHPDSNYGQAREMLLSKVAIPESNVHRFAGEMPPEEAAEAYHSEMVSALGDYPVLDLVILGMGADTHTASLFPGSPALAVTDRFAAANYVEKLQTHRLTLTYQAINLACEVLILALGTDKADAVRDALQGEQDPIAHPVQGVKPIHGRLLWVIDRDAAAKLGGGA